VTRTLPSTPALRALREAHVAFEVHPYRYEERGGTRVSARELGVDEHAIVKTLVLRDDVGQPMLMLMHGDREVSLKALARERGVRTVEPCREDDARRVTGYQFGGTSPFGTRRALPVYLERSVCDLPRLYINGGARGLLVSLAPDDLLSLLQPTLVSVATGHPQT
jgi:Cys-tRNA(Pro) deacylase